MSQHTPGPWVVAPMKAAARIYTEYSVLLADGTERPLPIVDNIGGNNELEFAANNHLIAAAPELLQACKIALKHFEDYCFPRGPMGEESQSRAFKALYAAIAKAEGSNSEPR